MRRPLPTSALSVAPALLSVPPRRCGMKFLHAALLGAALIAAPVLLLVLTHDLVAVTPSKHHFTRQLLKWGVPGLPPIFPKSPSPPAKPGRSFQPPLVRRPPAKAGRPSNPPPAFGAPRGTRGA